MTNAIPHDVVVPHWPDSLTITDPEATRLLFDPKRRPSLSPFMAAPTSISEAAESTDTLPNTMLATVRRCVTLGLLEHVGTTSRSGKAVRLYRTTARKFFVTLDASEDLMLMPELYWQRVFNDAFKDALLDYHYRVKPLGALIERIESGAVIVTGSVDGDPYVASESGPVVYFDWTVLQLDAQQAAALQRELDAVAERYRRLPAHGSSYFLVGAHLTPIRDAVVHQPAANASKAST